MKGEMIKLEDIKDEGYYTVKLFKDYRKTYLSGKTLKFIYRNSNYKEEIEILEYHEPLSDQEIVYVKNESPNPSMKEFGQAQIRKNS